MKKIKKIVLVFSMLMIATFILVITSKAATMLKVTGDTLNIRKGPSTDTSVVAMLNKGVECELLEESGDWYKVKYKTYTGYVNKKYVEVIGGESDTTTNTTDNNTTNNNIDPITGEPTNNNQQEDTDKQPEVQITYKKLSKEINAQILPLIYSNTIGTFKKGEEVEFITETTGWSYVQSNTISGWVRSEYLTDTRVETSGGNSKTEEPTAKEPETEKIGYINEEYVNVRNGASTTSKIVKVLALNTKVTIVGEDGDWYKIKSGNDIAYVSKQFLSDTEKKITSRSTEEPRTTENKEEKVEESSKNEINEGNAKDEEESNSNNKVAGSDVVAYAKQFLGSPYVYGGAGEKNSSGVRVFDCSGFTMYVYDHFGYNLPHGATSQSKVAGTTKITKQNDLQIGDIVFLTEYGSSSKTEIGHCGIYVGGGNFIHASTSGKRVVMISSLNTTYAGRFHSGIRLI